MCFSGRSVESYYQDIAPEKQELPSLKMDVSERKKPEYSDVKRGVEARSLLSSVK